MQGRNSVSKAGGGVDRQYLKIWKQGGPNMFVRMDLSLKYSQKRNFFHFFEQKNQIFKSRGVDAPHAPPPRSYAPDDIFLCVTHIFL